MVFARRLSAKKARFTCKKLAFLEVQRFQREEYGRWLTRRKRAERVLFLPSVKDEVGELSAESMQQILHQGSAFHFSKDLVVERQDSLHHLLFGGVFNVRRLETIDLVLLASVLTKLPSTNNALLSRALVQCDLRFDSLSLSEVAQLSFLIRDLPESLKEPFSRQWLPKVARLLRRLNSDSVGANLSSLAKLSYAISHFAPHLRESLFVLLSSLDVGDIPNAQLFSRDCSLVCQSMSASGVVNYDFLRDSSQFYESQLNQTVESLTGRLRRRQVLSGHNVVFDLEDGGVESAVDIDHLLIFLSTCERFGYHNRTLLQTFNSYVDCCSLVFVNECRAADHYRRHGSRTPNQLTKKFAEAVRGGQYKHPVGGKQQLQKLLKDLLASLATDKDGYWCLDAVHSIGTKYVTQRRNFARFLDFIIRNVNKDLLTTSEKAALHELCRSYQPFHCELTAQLGALTKDNRSHTTTQPQVQLCDDKGSEVVSVDPRNVASIVTSFREAYTSYVANGRPESLATLASLFPVLAKKLPDVVCWDCVWQMLHVIAVSRCVDMLPLVRSFLEESFLGYHPLSQAAGDASSVMSHLLDSEDTTEGHLLYLDSCVRIVELLLEADLSRDYADLHIFGHFFELLTKVSHTLERDKGGRDEDRRLLVERLRSQLERYLVKFSEVKRCLQEVEVPRPVYVQVLGGIYRHCGLDSLPGAMSAEKAVELLRSLCVAEDTAFISKNATLIRHILFQGCLVP
ncbi:non-canonical purine NTP pyrophosphatase, putative [Babesia ovata]|uniref:Non-canonical purine NTP pyrophosphatase, putative n=1 Tax=Babesia ovata TaxID=189622 RepID=A0A2H6KE58_9APIC|nr:non-canonical purine NTP pyrophosphatase, putative [Babesia ovata]GBE61275.1 non-canonical purine NTP pyrophosphatase, putative [Babesia ovata]